jgi:hypothetical protein
VASLIPGAKPLSVSSYEDLGWHAAHVALYSSRFAAPRRARSGEVEVSVNNALLERTTHLMKQH